jgi:hypothetical protein
LNRHSSRGTLFRETLRPADVAELLNKPPAVLRYEVAALRRIINDRFVSDDAKMRQFRNALHVGD